LLKGKSIMYRICDNVEIVETEKETIVIWEGKKVFSMNTTAIDILSFLKFPKTIDEVIDAMVEKYGDDQCVKDGVRLCVNQLLEYKLVEVQ